MNEELQSEEPLDDLTEEDWDDEETPEFDTDGDSDV